MNALELIFKWLILPGFAAYLVICILVYWQQERLIFIPQSLPQDYSFAALEYPHLQVFITMSDGEQIHGLWFPADERVAAEEGHTVVHQVDSGDGIGAADGLHDEETVNELPADRSRKLILYLHGNAGSLQGWGTIAGNYLGKGHDLFIPDYRGFGKSSGRIRSEYRFLNDMREVWQWALRHYEETNIIVIGYSVGTVPAAMIGAEGSPAAVVLKAPLYSARKLKRTHYRILPGFLLRYELNNAGFLPEITAPVHLLHGDADEIIPLSHGKALSAYLKPDDTFVIFPRHGHNGMNHSPLYHEFLHRLLVEEVY